jgi:hypothetical protein
MKPVAREEILDYVTYSEQRDEIRAGVMAAKNLRRFHVGEELTFLFENRDTIRYQVQEMMRVEQLVKEADIQHELDTYNEVLGGPGGFGATLLIEIEDEAVRPARLGELLDLPKHLYLELEDGTKVRASYDERQVGDDRLSSVQYLKFEAGGRKPVAIGADHPKLDARTELSAEQKKALEEDLAS